MEGTLCFQAGCNSSGLTPPVTEYAHRPECSVTGGYVYRGTRYPRLRGVYIFGDYCSGRIFGLRRIEGRWERRTLLETRARISTFGEDASGEIYVADHSTGTIYRLVDATTRPIVSAVTNGASYAGSAVPGSFATVFGSGIVSVPGLVTAAETPLPAVIGETSIHIGGILAPLFAVADVAGLEQINFQVPWELAGRASAEVKVVTSGIESTVVQLDLPRAQPGVFFRPDGHGAILHAANSSPVTPQSPAEPGEIVLIYATGLGPVADLPRTGSPAAAASATLSQTTVTIGGLDAPVSYSGLAPGLVGVYQINTAVPHSAASGPQDLVLTVEGQSSPPVRIAIR